MRSSLFTVIMCILDHTGLNDWLLNVRALRKVRPYLATGPRAVSVSNGRTCGHLYARSDLTPYLLFRAAIRLPRFVGAMFQDRNLVAQDQHQQQQRTENDFGER